MKCPACESYEQRVMTTRAFETRIGRLRRCTACGHRWNTVELSAEELRRLSAAADALRSFMRACRDAEGPEERST